ncbi:hypothetical protein Bca4012_103074 [Brassica carinata]
MEVEIRSGVCNNSPAESTIPEMDGAEARDLYPPSGKSQASMSRRARRSLQNLGREPGGAAAGGDLVGCRKYSNVYFEGRRGERFHVNGTCTWGVRDAGRNSKELSFLFNSLPTLETAQPEFQPADCWRTARAANAARAHAACRPGTDWEQLSRSFFGAEQPTQNCALNVKVKKFNQARFPLSLSTIQRNHSQGNGLGRISGKEDPVELDSSPTL